MKTDMILLSAFKGGAIIGFLYLILMLIVFILVVKLFRFLGASTIRNAIKEALAEYECEKEKPTA